MGRAPCVDPVSADRRRVVRFLGWWLLAAGAVGFGATALILWRWMHEPPDAKTLSALMTPRESRLVFLVSSVAAVAVAALGGRIILSRGEWPRMFDEARPIMPTDYPGLTLGEVGWGLIVPASHFDLSHKALRRLRRRVAIIAWTVVLTHVPLALLLVSWPWFRRHAGPLDEYMRSDVPRVLGWLMIVAWIVFNAWTDYVGFVGRRARSEALPTPDVD